MNESVNCYEGLALRSAPLSWLLAGAVTLVGAGCGANIEATVSQADGTCWIETDEVSDRYVYRASRLRNLVSFDRAGNESLPVTYEYDETGRLIAITELDGEHGGRVFEYNENGAVAEELSGDAVVYLYDFDEAQRVAVRTSQWGHETFAYDEENRLIEEVHYDVESAELRRVNYTYNGELLHSEHEVAPGYEGTTTYWYGESGLLLRAERDSTDGLTTYDLEYDRDGNLVSQYGTGEDDSFQQYRYAGDFRHFVCGLRDATIDPWLPFGGRNYSR